MARITVELLEVVMTLPERMQNDIQSFMEENPRACIYERKDIIDAWLTWNGIIGYTDSITELVTTIMKEKLNG